MSVQLILGVLTGCAVLLAAWQSWRADRLVATVLQREEVHADSRAEVIASMLSEQDELRRAHEREKAAWREERAELLSAALSAKGGEVANVAPGFGDGELPKLYRTEEDEIREAREQTAAVIDAELAARGPLLPGEGVA